MNQYQLNVDKSGSWQTPLRYYQLLAILGALLFLAMRLTYASQTRSFLISIFLALQLRHNGRYGVIMQSILGE